MTTRPADFSLAGLPVHFTVGTPERFCGGATPIGVSGMLMEYGLMPISGGSPEERDPMTWEEKLAALKSLVPTHLEMRGPGDWYVSATGRETKEGGTGLLGGKYGNGRTPEEAVEDDWRQIAGLPEGSFIVIDAYKEHRRHVRWAGDHWRDLPVVRRPRPKD